MPDEKRREQKEKPPNIEEIRRMLEDYASDLRPIIERLRKKLNGRSSQPQSLNGLSGGAEAVSVLVRECRDQTARNRNEAILQ
jgi:hypothetical protein